MPAAARKPPRSTTRTLLAIGGGLLILVAVATAIGEVRKPPSVQSSPTSSVARSATAQTPTTSGADLQRRAEALAIRRNPDSYKPLTEREFALLAKDPDAHKGELVAIYGEVTQFDAATGTEAFRADTGPLPPDSGEYYLQNSLVSVQDPSTVAEVVEDDVLKMYVEVAGAHTYETQMGGETTVPLFTLYIVENLSQALEQRQQGGS